MSDSARKFTRGVPGDRRADLVSAALSLMADAGPGAATVRAIAEMAGLSPGMIRHHFRSKEELLNAAYLAHMSRQTEDSARTLGTGNAASRLAQFVSASLTPPVVDARAVSLWAAFLHMVRRDAGMRKTHEATYLAYRDRLQGLIAKALAEAGRTTAPDDLRRLAIACNAVIDGLWLEGGVLPEAFAAGEVERIGLSAVGALIGLDLDGDQP